jgi:hypothetical protein
VIGDGGSGVGPGSRANSLKARAILSPTRSDPRVKADGMMGIVHQRVACNQ